MKKNSLMKFVLLTLTILLISQSLILARPFERYFDTAFNNSDSVRLTILYPSIGSIKALMNLREKGIFNVEKLIVVGVFHEMERTNYQNSIDMVIENDIDWIKFHKVSGELTKKNLYKKNPCTSDFEKIFKKSDGIIFFGGADIPPQYYANKTSLFTKIYSPYRSAIELSFIFHLLGGLQDKDFKGLIESEPGFPILGICLGEQSLNVGTGGTLTQDIWNEKYGKKYYEDVIKLGKSNWHTNPWARLHPEENLLSYNMHQIKFNKNGKFCKEFGFTKKDKVYIMSAHHQMVKKKGKGVKVIATSLDGKVVEAIEFKNFPNVLGVQFHPEFSMIWDTNFQCRFTPQDKEETCLLDLMKSNPPSYKFHKKIWEWFGDKLINFESQ